MATMRLTEALERVEYARENESIRLDVLRYTGLDNPVVTMRDARRLWKLTEAAFDVRSNVGFQDIAAFCQSRISDWQGMNEAMSTTPERLAVALAAVLAQAGELIVDEGYAALKAYYASDATAQARVKAKADALIAEEVG